MNLTNNWWGTSDPDSIETMMLYEEVDPDVGAEVAWQPFRTEPSTGGLKSIFRRP